MLELWEHHLYNDLIHKSSRKDKKLMTKVNDEVIHFGSRKNFHFYDKTNNYPHLNHLDEHRRLRYRKRHEAIKDKNGNLVYNNPLSPSYWSYRILW